MILLATPNPDVASETYVRQHLRLIDPENTAVLFFKGDGEAVKSFPSFKIQTVNSKGGIMSSFVKLYYTIFWGYPGIIHGREARNLARFIQANNIKSVFAEFGPTGCSLMKVCKQMDLRLTVNFHGHDATVMPKRKLIRRAYKFLNRNADAFVCGSLHFKKVLLALGFSAEKVFVIPCGIETSSFESISLIKDPNLVVAVGRFTEKKAPHLTIASFAQVLKDCPNSRLEMIGGGELLAFCKNLVEELGLQNNVILHGVQSHEFVKSKLAEASVFVQHSVVASNGDTESQGISLLEAMAASTPLVVTNHNGFKETVLEGDTGFLVDEKNIDKMAKRIIELLQNEQKRSRMGRLGRRRVLEYYEAKELAKKLKAIISA